MQCTVESILASSTHMAILCIGCLEGAGIFAQRFSAIYIVSDGLQIFQQGQLNFHATSFGVYFLMSEKCKHMICELDTDTLFKVYLIRAESDGYTFHGGIIGPLKYKQMA